uniref:Vitellogenin domain-containing protein n=1 Tax=Meloidogyne hapla TaxID=6305 RepID=A0A1I8BPT6_MELHA
MRTIVFIILLGLAGRSSGLLGDQSSDDYYSTSKQSPKFKNFFYREYNTEAEQIKTPSFQEDNEYVYNYDAQVENGLLSSVDLTETKEESQQQAITRIQSQIKMYFSSERRGQLCMTQLKFGQFNDLKQMESQQCCDPMQMFEPIKIPQETRQKLELCCQFDYVDGMVVRIQFDKQDVSWSENIKRGVLNMLQMNLRQNNGQMDNEGGNKNVDRLAHGFTVPEITVEGECQTSYTINKGSMQCQENQQPCSFNITKSINFKKCSKIADLTNGFQTEQPQLKCSQCPVNEEVKEGSEEQDGTGENQCADCDTRELNENMLDRQTIMRAMVKCGTEQKQQNNNCPNCCQLDNSEMISNYIYKNTKIESEGPYGSALRTKTCARLSLATVQTVQKPAPLAATSENDETLLYSNEWGMACRRFYMYGDEEFPDANSSPYKMPNVEQATQALQAIVQSTSDHHHGIKTKHTINLNRLVDKLRMCRYEDLKQIEQNAKNQNGEKSQKTATDVFVDSLATCGTRNCVKLLAEIIENEEVDENKAAFAINQLKNLPIPSNSILKQVKQLCQNVNVQNKPTVRQAAWLTFGALVNELCQHKSRKMMETSQDISKSIQEQCTDDKKEEYKRTLMEQYNQATTIYDKVLALSALGNAGIDTTTPYIDQIINDKSQHFIIRVKAIDALRRLYTKQPRTIQQILLPIFLNNREDTSVRSFGLSTLLRTQPEPSVVDQIFYAMRQEPNKRVKAYTYQTMKLIAESKNPADQQMSKHVKHAMQTVNINKEDLKFNMWQIPAYCSKHQEGLFFKLGAQQAQRGWMPNFSYLNADSYLKEQSNIDLISIYVMQGSEPYSYEETRNYSSSTTQNNQHNDNSKTLKQINKMLRIKSRNPTSMTDDEQSSHRQYSLRNQQDPSSILCVRMGDVDHACYGLNQNWDVMSSNTKNYPTAPPMLEEILQSIRRGEMPKFNSMTSKFGLQQLQSFQNHTFSAIYNEREAIIPTSIGLPVRVVNSVPMLMSVEGSTKMQNREKNEETKVQIDARIMAGISHVQRIGSWTPFLITGASSIRTVEVNLPVQAELSGNTETSNSMQSFNVKVKMPTETTRLLGVHSHQYTYKTGINSTTNMPMGRDYRTIRNPKLDRLQYQMDKVIGSKNVGVPVHVYAHYHWPSSADNIVQIIKMLTSTENAMHVTYQPGKGTAREVMFSMNTENFQPVKSFQPKMDNFFERSAMSEEEMPENQQQYYANQQQKMQKFLSKYQKAQKHQKHYKHSLEMSVKTFGGAKPFKCSAQLQAQCNDKMQVCQVKMEAQRSAMNEERDKWTMKGHTEMVMPGGVDSLEEDNSGSDQFLCFANCQWGANTQKQHVNMRIVGEQASDRTTGWYMFQRQQEEGEQQRGELQGDEQRMEPQQDGENQNSQLNMRLQRRAAFINLYNCRMQYTNLSPSTRNVFERAVELVKSKYFWNSKTELMSESNMNPANGKVYCTLSIDSLTQNHANITLMTPEQIVHLQQIELPIKLRPFSLMRRNARRIQSFDQFYSQQEVKNRAECSVDGRTKLKILTHGQTVECQHETSNTHKVRCMLNRRYMNEDDENNVMEYNNAKKSDLTVHMNEVSVRFNGYKAWIKLSGAYRNTQCGLCGHYDDATNDENEMIMANNEFTSNLAQFHRSYSLSTSHDSDDQMCNEQELNSFYEENKNKFGSSDNEMEEEMDEENEKENKNNNRMSKYNEWEDEMFDGTFDEENEDEAYFSDNYEGQTNMRNMNGNKRIMAPHGMTRMIEMENEICFSKQPIKQCPSGSYPTGWDNTGNNENQQENQESTKNENFTTKNVPFICLQRSDLETRQLLRQYKQNDYQIHMDAYKQHSFVEKVHEPKECRRA